MISEILPPFAKVHNYFYAIHPDSGPNQPLCPETKNIIKNNVLRQLFNLEEKRITLYPQKVICLFVCLFTFQSWLLFCAC